jgi:predicted Zn-dependent protease
MGDTPHSSYYFVTRSMRSVENRRVDSTVVINDLNANAEEVSAGDSLKIVSSTER